MMDVKDTGRVIGMEKAGEVGEHRKTSINGSRELLEGQ
jgi:hypothetical protein